MDFTNEISIDAERSTQPWVFFTNYWLVLIVIAREPGCRIRDIAARVGITERRAQSIVRDLAADSYLIVRKVGRRNVYEVNHAATFRHPLVGGRPIQPTLDLLTGDESAPANRKRNRKR